MAIDHKKRLFFQENEVRALFVEVEKKVIASFAPPKIEPEIEDVSMTETPGKKTNSITDNILNLPETPTDEPLAKDSDDFTSCLQLFQLLKTGAKALIIDVRPQENYNESRIKTNRCINLPADVIKPGYAILVFPLNHSFHKFQYLTVKKSSNDKMKI